MLNGKKITIVFGKQHEGNKRVFIDEHGVEHDITGIDINRMVEFMNTSINSHFNVPPDLNVRERLKKKMDEYHFGIDFGMNESQTAYSFHVPQWGHLDHQAINKSIAEQVDKNIMEMFGLSPFEVDGVHVTMTLIDVARGRNAGWPWMKTLSKDLAGRLPWTPFEENGVTRV